MEKRHQLVLVPVINDGESILYKDCDGQLAIGFNISRTAPDLSMHIHILSNETDSSTIVDGDWFYDPKGVDKVYRRIHPDKSKLPDGTRKIIATTDAELACRQKRFGGHSGQIPQLALSFVERFVDYYNRGIMMSEIFVEYEKKPIFGNNGSVYTITYQIKMMDDTISIVDDLHVTKIIAYGKKAQAFVDETLESDTNKSS